MRIFIGFENISSTVTDITRAFQAMGHTCYTAINHEPSVVELNTADFILQKEFDRMPRLKPDFLGIRVSVWWQKLVRTRLFNMALKECDLFIFFWSTFFHDFSDLAMLKKHGKKIVFVFVGDDARWRRAASQEFNLYGISSIPEDEPRFSESRFLERNLSRIRHAERYADIIFSRLDQGQLQLRAYHRWNMMVDPANYVHAPTQSRTNPLIVHAPTARLIKGTAFIEEALNRLKGEGVQFRSLFIENTPHKEAVKIYQQADILVDQLIIPGTGKFASEGLAMGKVVIAQMGYGSYPQKNPDDCPIIDADKDSIYTVLKELIENHEKRTSIALKGREYAERHLHPRLFCEKILNSTQNKMRVDPDYIPIFFRNHFVPEPENLTVYNQWTDFVKTCSWYRKEIKSGTREGLIF